MFGGLRGMSRVPDALFIVDPKQESAAVAEALQLKLPIISLLNSDCDGSHIAYPIPGNDASLHVITYILNEVAKAYADNLGAEKPADLPVQAGAAPAVATA
jgi:small subunit ribosomal protein S2